MYLKLVLTVIFFTAGVFYVHNGDIREGLQVELGVKSSYEDTIRLYIGAKNPQEVKLETAGEIRTIRFFLPREKITNLRLNLGETPGTVVVESIRIKNPFSSYHLEGKRLPMLFREKQGIRKDYVRDRYYYVETTRPDHVMVPGDAFYKAVEKLQRQKTSFYLLAAAASLFFFYFIHSFNFGVWRGLTVPRPWVKGVPVVLFVLLICMPLADQVFDIFKKPHLAEKRPLARKPEFRPDTLFDYPKKNLNYYNDHFPFRQGLIFLNNLLKVKLWKISPSAKVLMGKDQWLFYDDAGPNQGTVEYYRSLTLFTTGELEQWKNLLEQRFQWLAARGIHYLFVAAPNKNTIYPELMPDHIRKVHRESRLDQLLAYLARHSRVPVLDLRPALTEARKQYPVYWRTDTHWSDFGAYIANREIIKYVSAYFKGAEPLPLSRFKIERDDHMGGDLAEMLWLHEEIMREDIFRLNPDPPFTAKSGSLKNISAYVRQGYSECSAALLPNILMVHDSFYNRLKPFLSEQFSRVLYIWDWDFNFYPEIIAREKPKLVIDEMAERFLLGKIPVNPLDVRR